MVFFYIKLQIYGLLLIFFLNKFKQFLKHIYIPMESLGQLIDILKEVAISSFIPYSRSLLLCSIL